VAVNSMAVAGVENHAKVVRRVQWLTITIGVAGAIVTAVVARSARLGGGVAVGTVLAWLNCHWLDQAIGAITRAAVAQSDAPKAHVPPAVYWKGAARYLLIGLVIFVTVVWFKLPLIAVVCGLFAFGAAAMVEGFYQVVLGFPKG
jgi:hypothetical protein